jgi:hypothetical protein
MLSDLQDYFKRNSVPDVLHKATLEENWVSIAQPSRRPIVRAASPHTSRCAVTSHMPTHRPYNAERLTPLSATMPTAPLERPLSVIELSEMTLSTMVQGPDKSLRSNLRLMHDLCADVTAYMSNGDVDNAFLASSRAAVVYERITSQFEFIQLTDGKKRSLREVPSFSLIFALSNA